MTVPIIWPPYRGHLLRIIPGAIIPSTRPLLDLINPPVWIMRTWIIDPLWMIPEIRSYLNHPFIEENHKPRQIMLPSKKSPPNHTLLTQLRQITFYNSDNHTVSFILWMNPLMYTFESQSVHRWFEWNVKKSFPRTKHSNLKQDLWYFQNVASVQKFEVILITYMFTQQHALVFNMADKTCTKSTFPNLFLL